MFYCDGKLKRACNVHGLIRNAQLQAAVNCSSFCTLHVVMEITNAKPYARALRYGVQQNAIARQQDFCYIFI